MSKLWPQGILDYVQAIGIALVWKARLTTRIGRLGQVDRATQMDPNHEPTHISQGSDPFLRAKLHHLPQQDRMQTIDRHPCHPCVEDRFQMVSISHKPAPS